mgnify:CR=1 FL=1
MTDTASAPLLAVDNLSIAFGPSRVVENLSFSVRAGRTLAIVGESGSGKSVTSLSVMRLADMMGGQFPTGQVLFESRQGRIDLTTATQKTMRGIRGKVFLHRSAVPLEEADLSTAADHGQLDLWPNECEGMCGV